MAHYVANRADYTARAIAYMAANADRYREAARQRRANAPDEFRAKERAYYAANRQAFAVVHQRRRAHKLNNPGSVGVSPPATGCGKSTFKAGAATTAAPAHPCSTWSTSYPYRGAAGTPSATS